MTTRLENGLLPEQSLVIQALATQPDWKKACDEAGVPYANFRRWIRMDAAFRDAYNGLHSGVIDAVRAQIEATAQKAAEVFDEATEATRDVSVEIKCPNCNTDIKITAEVPDWNVRMRAGETSLKVAKILKDVKEVGGVVTIAQLPLHLQIAYAAYKREGATAIPPGAYDQLVEAGIIKGALPAPKDDTVEAEWHEVDSADKQPTRKRRVRTN